MTSQPPKILGFDIEAFGLSASFGHIICCSFIDMMNPKAKPETFRIDDYDSATDDLQLVREIKNKLEGAWIWSGWYSKMYDIPMINGRLATHGIRPVEKRLHLDLLYYSRGQFMKFHSSKLDSVAKTFELKTQKTDIYPAAWVKASRGDKESIDYIVDHCEQDVKVLREAFHILYPYVRNIHT